MIDNIIIREYKESDKNQVLELLNRNFEKQQHLKVNRNENWWKWKYEDNIFGKPIIYVATHNEKIIGVRPFWPWKLNIRMKEFNCFQPIDSVVDNEYRGLGIFTRMTKKAILENEDKIDLIFNFPNNQSLRGYLNIGWSYIGKLEWYVKINRPIETLSLLKNYTNFNSLKLNEINSITASKISNIKYKGNINGKLKTSRSKSFLTWRYLNHPVLNYGMGTVISGNKALNYIYEINESEHGRELIVVDYFGELAIFDKMLKDINDISKNYKAAYIIILKKYDTPSKVLIRNLYFKLKRKIL